MSSFVLSACTPDLEEFKHTMSSKRLRIDEVECDQARMSPICEQNSGETSRCSSVGSPDSPVPATISPVLTIRSVRSLSEDVAANTDPSSSQGGTSGEPTVQPPNSHQAKTDGYFPRHGGKSGRPLGTTVLASCLSAYEYKPQCTIKASSANGVVVAKGEHAYAFCDVEHGRAVLETLDRKIAAVIKKTADVRKKLGSQRTRYLRDRNLLKQLNNLREFRKLPKLVFNVPQKRENRQIATAPVTSPSGTNAAKKPRTCDLSGSEDDTVEVGEDSAA